MDKNIQPTKNEPGMFIRGIVISNSAKLFHRKDGSGSSVVVTQEIATQPGVVEYTRYFDVGKTTEIKVQGEEVLEYPRFPQMKSINLKVLAWKAFDKKFVITRAEPQSE